MNYIRRKYPNVYYERCRDRWRVQFQIDGRQKCVGLFPVSDWESACRFADEYRIINKLRSQSPRKRLIKKGQP